MHAFTARKRFVHQLSCRLTLLIVFTGFFARAGEKTEPAQSPDTRPPGGNGDLFYRVFLSNNDANGDGVVTKEEFRGSATRFDAMDKDSNGKLDRDKIGELHRSRVADPLRMKQRLETGQTFQPPVGVRPPGVGGGTPPAEPADGTKPGGEASPAKGEPFAGAPNGRQITGKQAFERFDVNTDGKITEEEFRRSPGMSDEAKAKATVTKVDKDGDGVLSMEQFLTVFNQRHAASPNNPPAAPPAKQ